jgi:hypothetical protein
VQHVQGAQGASAALAVHDLDNVVKVLHKGLVAVARGATGGDALVVVQSDVQLGAAGKEDAVLAQRAYQDNALPLNAQHVCGANVVLL